MAFVAVVVVSDFCCARYPAFVQISRLSNDRTRLMALFEAVHDHLPPSNRKLLATKLWPTSRPKKSKRPWRPTRVPCTRLLLLPLVYVWTELGSCRYVARNDEELSFLAGDLLQIDDQSDANWWHGFATHGAEVCEENIKVDLEVDLEVDPMSRRVLWPWPMSKKLRKRHTNWH
jgi:hypothetical protein